MMNRRHGPPRTWIIRNVVGALALAICTTGSAIAQTADEAQPPESAVEEGPAGIPSEELESLVAPIALYPDALLAQTLVAATYPLEIIQLQQWLGKNPGLEGEALTSALEEQPWDPSIKSMAAVPEVVDRLANDIQWTTDLGNAFLAQQEDVMDAAQTMRRKAQQKGALESNEQMTVETQVVERDTVIIVETADPEVIYVPVYDPVVVYPPVVYAYPPIYYPPPPPAGLFITFSVGVAWGAHYGGSCCGCGWGGGGNNIYINNSNNFNQINHRGGAGQGADGKWQHNPEHRGAAPYGDKATAGKYGGSARGQSPSNRPGAATRPTTSDRSAGGDRAGSSDRPAASDRSAGGDRPAASDRSAVGERPAANDRSGSGSARPAPSDRSGSQGAGNRGGVDRSSSQRSGSSKSGGAFGGGSQGYDRGSAQASRSRGASSRGSRGGRR